MYSSFWINRLNRNLGNDKPIEIKFHEESSILEYWIKGLPLKLITHGWLGSLKNPNGVISIKTGMLKKQKSNRNCCWFQTLNKKKYLFNFFIWTKALYSITYRNS